MDRFVGKVAVVTGASRGIGEQIVKALLKRGVNVIGLARSSDKLQAVSEEVASQPEIYKGKFSSLKCDVSNEEDVKETFSKIKANFGVIVILINNAAVAEPVKSKTPGIDITNFHQIFDTNVKGFCLCSNEAIELMTDSAGGHIININSLLGLPHFSLDFVPLYSNSKKTIRDLTDFLRKQFAKKRMNIKISTVSPGLVNTDMPTNAGLPLLENPDEILSPEDVANGCIAVLDTPLHVLVSEYTVVARFAEII